LVLASFACCKGNFEESLFLLNKFPVSAYIKTGPFYLKTGQILLNKIWPNDRKETGRVLKSLKKQEICNV
jgi:hypothetical protein